eukprot:GHVT01062258.1.p2 GENE.GHVT01062258.1~~GHVT01062258.1.p2  ORF type:complete len:106 (-),score=21.15 GHVT01062258.1:260-577(-)
MGDGGDEFIVECVNPSDKVWLVGATVRLFHVNMKGHLAASRSHMFTRDNCPRCPILGHLEVAITKRPSASAATGWRCDDGLLVEAHEDDHKKKHSEHGHKGNDEL